MAEFFAEEEEKMMERRLKERSIIAGLEVAGKKKVVKDFIKMSKDLALRMQIMKEKMEANMGKLQKQTNATDGSSANNDKAIREKCVKEVTEVIVETSEIQKVLQIAIEEGTGTARGFNEKFSFSLSEKDRKEIQKIKKRKEDKKQKKDKKSKKEAKPAFRSGGRGSGPRCFYTRPVKMMNQDRFCQIPKKDGGGGPELRDLDRKRVKVGYSRKQDLDILNYIIMKKCYKNLVFNRTWQKMEKRGVCEGKRSWLSIKERFRTQLINKLDQYHLSPLQIRQMRGGIDPDEMLTEDDWSSPVLTSDDENVPRRQGPRFRRKRQSKASKQTWWDKFEGESAKTDKPIEVVTYDMPDGTENTDVESIYDGRKELLGGNQLPPHLQKLRPRTSSRKRGKLYNPHRSFVDSPTNVVETVVSIEDMLASTLPIKMRISNPQNKTIEHGGLVVMSDLSQEFAGLSTNHFCLLKR